MKDLALGPVLEAVVRRAAEEVFETEDAALADEPDGVHQHRVRVRRLRSVLAGFRDVLDGRAADRLRVWFAEWGRQLGVVRDLEVSATVAEEALAEAGIEEPAVRRRLVESERAAYVTAHTRLVELARSPRGGERSRELRAFAAAPGVVEPKHSAAAVLAKVLVSQAKRVEKANEKLDGTEERYHDLRKAARRLRYVAEAVADGAPNLFRKEVGELAEAGDTLHDALGAHRDAMLLAERAAREGALAGRAGEPSGAYDIVAGIARAAADKHLAEVPQALERVEAAASRLS